MSGILCVYDASGIEQSLEPYSSALRLLSHRGPDAQCCELRRGVFLGVRLSRREWGSAAKPSCSAGNVAVALDSRIQNREELVGALRKKGCRTDLSSDCALVGAVYSEYGEQSFERFHGPWAIVLWDERSNRLIAGRDRIGVKPLYYYVGAGKIIIASEIKSILALDRAARSIDQRRLRQLICEGRIDDWTGTCFAQIKPVPPGSVLRIDGRRTALRRYWSLRPTRSADATPTDVLEKLVAAVERHTPSDVRIGLALSGGIDSSSIAGILAHTRLRLVRDVQAFSIRPPKTADESFLIDATLRHTAIPHVYVPLDTLDYARSLRRLIDYQDEPIHYSGVFYQFFLRQCMAEAGCRAVLVGYGSDEIFSGYTHLAPAFLWALLSQGSLWRCARFVLGANRFIGSRTLLKQALRFVLLRRADPISRALERSIRYALGKSKDAAAAGDLEILAATGEVGEPAPAPMSEFDLSGLGPGRVFLEELLRCFRTNIPLLVRLEDRNAAAHGLELCAPFMDEELIQLALSFPYHRYMEHGWNKAILRAAVHDLLAPEVSRFRAKLPTPGNDGYLAFEMLREELLDLLNSSSFRDCGLWSTRCPQLYQSDMARNARPHLWFRTYMTHRWYEQIVRRA